MTLSLKTEKAFDLYPQSFNNQLNLLYISVLRYRSVNNLTLSDNFSSKLCCKYIDIVQITNKNNRGTLCTSVIVIQSTLKLTLKDPFKVFILSKSFLSQSLARISLETKFRSFS